MRTTTPTAIGTARASAGCCVNVYDRIYVARGEQIVDVWPIMGRSGAPQR